MPWMFPKRIQKSGTIIRNKYRKLKNRLINIQLLPREEQKPKTSAMRQTNTMPSLIDKRWSSSALPRIYRCRLMKPVLKQWMKALPRLSLKWNSTLKRRCRLLTGRKKMLCGRKLGMPVPHGTPIRRTMENLLMLPALNCQIARPNTLIRCIKQLS